MLHYTVPEEAKHGTFVGRIAQDLGLELAELVPRLFRVASKTHGDLLEVNLQNGILFVNSRIDREKLCGRSAECSIHLEVIVDRPLQVFHVDVEVKDINDNPPDAQVGTVIALISVSDRDSGANGQVICSLTPHVPFKLVSTYKNYYSLVLDSALDRETVSAYELVVTARDGGFPSLWATASVSVEVADVNDNAPAFAQPEYTVFVKENNPPGCHIFTVSAQDADAQENALVSYSLVERRVGDRALSSYVSVHAESGKVYALQPLDHEKLELLQFQVSARDAGVPPLGSNVTLQVFVLDENDNAPALLATRAGIAGGAVSELLQRSVGAGHVVAKVRAVDADSGYNAWLSYELQPAAVGPSIPFRVGLYTGEISTTRILDEADAPRHRLLVLVKDHGEPALTTTATVLVSLVENGQAPKASLRASVGAVGPEMALVDVNVYLIIAICAVSSLLVLTLLLYTALRCSAPPTPTLTS
ncbi:Protocadherin alpha-12 [Saguinus oedipus]|uniref:Protocadherin alpha-12 n=1 Tax=Saguinus oedipus TaxID=9490 RepID=A0ABQ9W7N8_SAGOE|nr:Protocadherin alpha-12 [Saguinus oedipus]